MDAVDTISEVNVEQLNLGELITALDAELAKGDRVLPIGFSNPHSYRGDYIELAFEPVRDIALSEVLLAARGALGATFQGWKGGDFTMSEHTLCWIAHRGCGAGETIGALGLELLLTFTRDEEAVRNDAADTQPQEHRP